MIWDWLSSPQTVERRGMQNLTPLARAALMDAIRRSLPEENRPQTFEQALSGGTLDPGTLDFLLGQIRSRVPPHDMAGGGGTIGG